MFRWNGQPVDVAEQDIQQYCTVWRVGLFTTREAKTTNSTMSLFGGQDAWLYSHQMAPFQRKTRPHRRYFGHKHKINTISYLAGLLAELAYLVMLIYFTGETHC